MSDLHSEVLERESRGLVKSQRHATLPLTIYNYAERVQYDKLWDDVLEQCRGLVFHDDGTIAARPFRKFYNDTEYASGEVPWHLPCEITEKLDGSLLIVFHAFSEWRASTRGSFVSEQAIRGLQILHDKYGVDGLDQSVTYLFEVLYPENRIVVDYGGRVDVVLIGMIETESGCEIKLDYAPSGLSVVQRAVGCDPKNLRSIIRDDEEGYVVRFDNGQRVKVKGERYRQIHAALSGLTSRTVWEAVSSGQAAFDQLIAAIPDEFHGWVHQEADALWSENTAKVFELHKAVDSVRGLATRKEQAIALLRDHREMASAAFLVLDGRDFMPVLWKMVYPELRRPVSGACQSVD